MAKPRRFLGLLMMQDIANFERCRGHTMATETIVCLLLRKIVGNIRSLLKIRTILHALRFPD